MTSKASQFVVRHRVAASILGFTILGSALVFGAMAGAQKAPWLNRPGNRNIAAAPRQPQIRCARLAAPTR